MIAKGTGSRLTTEPTTPRPNIEGIVEKLPVISDRPDRTMTVDSEYVPSSHLLTHIEGSNWRTKAYYRQLLGLNEEARPQQLGTSAVHQEYERIEGFILKAVTPLAQSQDEETKEFQVTGDGGVYYGLVPNFGDMFIADMADGREGIFTLTRTQRMSYSKAACYEAGWQLVDFNTPEREADLETKVVRRLVFDPTMLEMLDTPFLTEQQSVCYRSLDDYSRTLTRLMKERYWTNVVQNYMVPDMASKIHDGFHMEYCRFIDLSDDLHPINIFQNGQLKYEDVTSIWTLLKELSDDMLPYVCRKFGLVETYKFRNSSVLRGVGFTQFDATLYPQENIMEEAEAKRKFPPYCKFISPKPLPEITTLSGTPLYAPVDKDEYYVFTQAFYDGDKPSMSVIERLTADMLHDKPVDAMEVQAVCEEVPKMRRLEQYYFIPVLLTLIRYCKRGYSWRP